jgi:hypothetical protein
MSKLTLHVSEDLINAAKREAASRGTSVSRLVSDYFRAFSRQPARSNGEVLPPITASLVGCIRDADARHQVYVDYLERKHQ